MHTLNEQKKQKKQKYKKIEGCEQSTIKVMVTIMYIF